MTASTDRPKGKSLRPLRALVPFVKPYLGTFYLAMAALVLASLAQLALPIAIRVLIDAGLLAKDAASIDRYFAGLFAVAMAFGLFSALRFYLVTWLGERVVADIRNAVYRQVVRLDPTFFEVTKTGEVLSRLTTDTTLIQSVSGAGLSIALRSILNLAGAVIMLVVTSPRLAAMILLLLPLVIVPIIIVGRRVRTLSRASQDRIADTSGLAGESLNAIATVQAFTLEGLQSARFASSVAEAFRTAVQRIRVRALLTGIAILFIFGAITCSCCTRSLLLPRPPASAKCGARCSAQRVQWKGWSSSWMHDPPLPNLKSPSLCQLKATGRSGCIACVFGTRHGRTRSRSTIFRSTSAAAKRLPSSARPAPAKARCFSYCSGFTTRSPAISRSRASTSAKLRHETFAPRSASSRRRR
jgi:hypothetical protein